MPRPAGGGITGRRCRRSPQGRPPAARRPGLEEELTSEFLRAGRRSSDAPLSTLRPAVAGAAGSSPTGGAAVSLPPYDSFNLGDHVGDDPAAVAANRARLAARAGRRAGPAGAGCSRCTAPASRVVDGPRGRPGRATDALVTAERGLALVVLVADCVPVLLADPAPGWSPPCTPGARASRPASSPPPLAAMRDLGARPAATDGAARARASAARATRCPPPCRPRCAVAPAGRRPHPPGHRRAGPARRAGRALGPPASARSCTTRGAPSRTATLFSHRRDGVTGRQAGVVWLEPDLTRSDRARPTTCGHVRARVDAAARAAGRDPAERAAAGGQQDLPGRGRARARRARPAPTSARTAPRSSPPRPPSSPTCRCAGTSSASCSATRRPRWPGSAPSSTPSTGWRWRRRWPRAGEAAGTPVEVLLQVDLGGPEGELAARGGVPPAELPGAGRRRRRRRRGCGCAG